MQVINWIASLMITIVAFAMLKFYNLERKWRHKLEGATKNVRAAGGRGGVALKLGRGGAGRW